MVLELFTILVGMTEELYFRGIIVNTLWPIIGVLLVTASAGLLLLGYSVYLLRARILMHRIL
jgi:membrane protease YdiL (CAAX protease family)